MSKKFLVKKLCTNRWLEIATAGWRNMTSHFKNRKFNCWFVFVQSRWKMMWRLSLSLKNSCHWLTNFSDKRPSGPSFSWTGFLNENASPCDFGLTKSSHLRFQHFRNNNPAGPLNKNYVLWTFKCFYLQNLQWYLLSIDYVDNT